jgi:hypothetical protein
MFWLFPLSLKLANSAAPQYRRGKAPISNLNPLASTPLNRGPPPDFEPMALRAAACAELLGSPKTLRYLAPAGHASFESLKI